jgi:lipopolysaccharide export system protein LptA
VDEWIEGFAERAEFDDRNDVLKLFNRARVKRNNDELTGDFITYDMKQRRGRGHRRPGRDRDPQQHRARESDHHAAQARREGRAAKSPPPLELKPDAGSQ